MHDLHGIFPVFIHGQFLVVGIQISLIACCGIGSGGFTQGNTTVGIVSRSYSDFKLHLHQLCSFFALHLIYYTGKCG